MKIALFLDNCTAHPNVQSLDSIQFVFLPANTTSEIQPCDQGIIRALKTYYRKHTVQCLIQFIDQGHAVTELKITLLDAIQMIKMAWDAVTPNTIQNCFKKGSFIVPSGSGDSVEVDENEPGLDPVSLDGLTDGEIVTFDEYVNSDSYLQCMPMPTVNDIA